MGPGEKNLFSQEFSWGLFLPAFDHDNQTQVWGSNDFVYGLNYRAKVAPFLGFGGNFNAHFFQYKIRQHADKFYPDSTLWDKQRLSVSAFQFTFFTRLYLTPKDDAEGLYLDLGVSSDLMVYRENFFLDRDAASGAKRTRERGIQYMNFASYGFIAKINYNYIGVFATYRMSNLFKEYQGSQYGELPRFSVGLVVRPPVMLGDH
jgi:hypothetical protein